MNWLRRPSPLSCWTSAAGVIGWLAEGVRLAWLLGWRFVANVLAGFIVELPTLDWLAWLARVGFVRLSHRTWIFFCLISAAMFHPVA